MLFPWRVRPRRHLLDLLQGVDMGQPKPSDPPCDLMARRIAAHRRQTRKCLCSQGSVLGNKSPFTLFVLVVLLALVSSSAGIGAEVDLTPGVNLLAPPLDPSTSPDISALYQALGGADVVERIEFMDSAIGAMTSCRLDADGTPLDAACSLPLLFGNAWAAYAASASVVELNYQTDFDCPTLVLSSGTQLVSFPCAAPGLSAKTLLFGLGIPDRASALRSLDTDSGRWRSVSQLDGLLFGDDFPILGDRGYLVDMLAPRTFLDSDGDGLDDNEELDQGTDPSLTDSDGDRLIDGLELRLGLDPTIPETDDRDGDGLADAVETHVVGTDPDNPDSDGDGIADGLDPNPLTPDIDPTLPLPTDGFDNTGYGNGYGSDAHPSRISFSFQSDGGDWLLHLRAFDVDVDDELGIFLNGILLGHPAKTGDQTLGRPSLWWLPTDLQRNGENRIEVRLLREGWTWGVDQLGLLAPGRAIGHLDPALGGIDSPASDGYDLYLPDDPNGWLLGSSHYAPGNASTTTLSLAGATVLSLTTDNATGFGPTRYAVLDGDWLADGRRRLTIANERGDTNPWGLALQALLPIDSPLGQGLGNGGVTLPNAGVGLLLPDRQADHDLTLGFFDIDADGEVVVGIDGGAPTAISATGADAWGPALILDALGDGASSLDVVSVGGDGTWGLRIDGWRDDTITNPALTGELNRSARLTIGIYDVASDFSIGRYGELICEPGVELRMPDGFRLQVDGTLRILGNTEQPVRLTPASEQPSTSQWQGIRIGRHADDILIDGAVIEYADIGILFDDDSSGQVANSLIRHNRYGIAADPRSRVSVVPGNTISYNSYGVVVNGDRSLAGNPIIVVTGNDFYANSTYDYYAYNFADVETTILDARNNWWGEVFAATGAVPETGALGFDGNSFVEINDGPATDLTGDLTIELWVKPRRFANQWMPLVFKGDGSGSDGRTYTLWLEDSGYIHLTSSDGSQQHVNSSNGSVPRDQWTHVAAVIDRGGGALRLYINGVLDASSRLRAGPSVTNDQPLRVGWTHESQSSYSPFDGELDEFRLWSEARTEAQINADMHRALNGSEAGLELLLPFNDATDAEVVESLGPHGVVAEVVQRNPIGPYSIEPRIHNRRDHSYSPLIDYGGWLADSGGAPAIDSGTLIGPLAADTELAADSVYHALYNVTVPAGVTLTFNPGSELHWPYDYGLSVDGTLDINGALGNPAVLTSGRQSPARSDWIGIRINADATDVAIDHAQIEYADHALHLGPGASAALTDSLVRQSYHSAVWLDTDSNGSISGSTIRDNRSNGIYVGLRAAATITGNLITANEDDGIDLDGDHAADNNPTAVINANDLYGNNAYDLLARNFGAPERTIIDARGNWWGTQDVLAIKGRIYDRHDSGNSPWVDFGGWLSAEEDGDFAYRVLNPRAADQPAGVIGYSDGGLIQGPVSDLYLDAYGLGELPIDDLSLGARIQGNTRFALGNSADGGEFAVPDDLAGTQFIVPQVRGSHVYHLLAPEDDEVVEITVPTAYGSLTRSVFLPAGVVVSIPQGDENGQAALIESQGWPILVLHDTEAGEDLYAVPPTATELWGVKSTGAYVAAAQDGTTVQAVADDGTSETLSLDAGELAPIGIGSSAAQGQGSAIHLIADKPIAAIQQDDGDGTESTAFWPAWLHSSRH
ncbi:MAG TPA: hypothetical protein DIW77_01670, partial [Chromatiaceae bacterium]|nr:hypothetical protein [Chromatiaceae bacterium]